MTNAAVVATTRDAARAAIADTAITPDVVTHVAIAESKGRRLRRRHLWLVPGLAIAIYANMLGGEHGVGIPALIAFGIAPDLPRWLGRFLGGRSQLALSIANLLHQPLVAFAGFAIAAAGTASSVLPMVVLVAALIWSSHVVIGWGVGDGIRHRERAVQR